MTYSHVFSIAVEQQRHPADRDMRFLSSTNIRICIFSRRKAGYISDGVTGGGGGGGGGGADLG